MLTNRLTSVNYVKALNSEHSAYLSKEVIIWRNAIVCYSK